jgi:beta-lactamase class A
MTRIRPVDETPAAARDGRPEGARAAANGRGRALTRALVSAGGLAAAAASPLPAQGLASARAAIEARIAASGAEAVGVYAQDLERADTLQIGAAIRFHAASMMKVPVMIQVFRDVDAGRLRLGGRVPVVNAFRSLVDGSPYALSAGDDSDSSLYGRVGRSATLRELVELMITASSNLATNIVIDRVQAARAQATAVALGADSIQVRRGVEDAKAFRAGLNNTTTARDLGVLFAALAQGRAASGASCRTMLDVLGRQRFNEGIPSGLPAGTRVAHKTGWITGTSHDGGVVSAPDGRHYVLVVLTRGIQEEAAAARLIADIAGLVHGALSPR